MVDIEVLKLLETFIESADSEKMAFLSLDKNAIAKRRNSIIDFEHQIFKFLDYIFTNFPTGENKNKGLHFIRPDFKKSKQEYFKKYKKAIKVSSPKLDIFLDKSFDIIANNQFAISLLEGGLKHETIPDLATDHRIDGKYHSNYPNPIKKENGFTNIGGVIRVNEGANIAMSNCVVIDGNNHLVIDYLQTTHIKGDTMIFGKHNIKINFKNFANDCINTCKEMMEEIKKIN